VAETWAVERPDTRYAQSGEIHVAYQVFGDGPVDLVFVPGFISNVEMAWHQPVLVSFFERLARFARVIWFDKRGTGASDPVEGYQRWRREWTTSAPSWRPQRPSGWR
jgi:pimeloyl-ACP methyl ester carboxylesterase